MKTLVTRLRSGQDLLDSIQKLVNANNVRAGVILSGVGSLKTSNIRVAVIEGKVTYINPVNLEIDSLHGTVSTNGCHLHITVSDVKGKAMGGHVKNGCIVRTTCEIVIGILDDITFNRETDQETGFDELVLS